MNTKKDKAMIDIFKLIMALCVIGLHTGFLLDKNYGYYVHSLFFRLGVPFFFITSGYFLACKTNENNRKTSIKNFIKSNIYVYFLLGLIFIIMNLLVANDFSSSLLFSHLWQLLIGNSWSVMWYVGSAIISAIVLLHLDDKNRLKKALFIFTGLFLVGLLFNNYSILIANNDFQFFYYFLLNTFGNNRNWIFVGFLFFGLGYYMQKNGKLLNKYNDSIKAKMLTYLLFLIGLIITIVEVIIIKKYLYNGGTCEYFLGHLLLIPALFIILLNSKLNNIIKINTKFIRKTSTYIYFFHYFIFDLLTKFTTHIYTNIGLYTLVCFLTILFSTIFYFVTKKKSNEPVICLGLYTISFVAILFSSINLYNKVFWVDEACSLKMITHTFKNIIVLNANDVHPPLYYLMLKTFSSVLSNININQVILGKIFSTIPLIILIIFSITKIRKNFGSVTSALFIFFLIFMPNMMQYFFEIRMYSWGLCFVTIAFLYFYDIIKTNNIKSWILFYIFSILAAYTHLYSCLAICLMFLFLLIYFAINKDGKSLKKWFGFGLLTFVSYIPWIIPLLKKIVELNSSGFWIPKITFKDCLDYVRYIFFAETNNRLTKNFFGIMMIIILIKLLINNIKNKDFKEKYYVYVGALILGLTIGIGVLVSIIKTPVFLSRYMHSSLGCMWLSYSICLSKFICKNKYNVLVLFIPLFIGTVNLNGFIRKEIFLADKEKDFSSMQKTLENNDIVIISNSNHIQLVTGYLHPNNSNIYLYNNSNNNMLNDLFGNTKDDINEKDIQKFLDNEKQVYFLLEDNTINLQSELSSSNICYNNLGHYVLDWYYMSLNELIPCQNTNTK